MQSARLNLATDFWSGGNTTENLVIQAGSCPSSTLQWSELMLKLRSVWHSGAERIVFTIISWIYIIRQMFQIFWVFVQSSGLNKVESCLSSLWLGFLLVSSSQEHNSVLVQRKQSSFESLSEGCFPKETEGAQHQGKPSGYFIIYYLYSERYCFPFICFSNQKEKAGLCAQKLVEGSQCS